MKKLFSLFTISLFTTVAYNQTDTSYQLTNSQNQSTLTIDTVHSDFELTPQEFASFKILADNRVAEFNPESSFLISYDMFQKIEAARSQEENVIIIYQDYTILVYRKSLEQEAK